MKLILVILLFVSTIAHGQQDPLYSQYMQNALLINPAYTSTYDMFSATVNVRRQWAGIESAPVTNSLTAHTSFLENKLGGGLILVSDKYGLNQNTEAHGTLAYKLRLSDRDDKVLSFGMQLGMVNYRLNYESLTLKYLDDPNFPQNQISITKPSVGAGIFYRSESMFAGISVPKMLNTNYTEGASQGLLYRRHFFLTGGYIFDFSSVQIKPSVLVKYVEGAPVSIDLNGSVLLRDFIWLGASVRNLNTIVLMAQVQLTDMLRLGYAADVPLTNVKTLTTSHELMLNIDLKLLKSHDIGLRYF